MSLISSLANYSRIMQSKDRRLSISKLKLRDLGIVMELPEFSKFSDNLENRQLLMAFSREKLLTQHATTGYKIGSAAIFVGQIEKFANFHNSWGDNIQEDFENTIKENYHFQIALECFFTFTWGAITSLMRELWLTFALNIARDSINFFMVKEAMKKEYPKTDLTMRLQEMNDSEWHRYLNGARNRVEHGQIPMTQYRLKERRLYLADNQTVDAGMETYLQDYDPIAWPKSILEEVRQSVEYCCSAMNRILF